MPFNPGQFVFQPRPLQQFDFGAGFRDLANTRLQKQQQDNQNRQANATRFSTDSLAAANFAKDQQTNQYDADNKRYVEGAKLAEQIRQAYQANDLATAEALSPGLLELGGTVEKDAAGNPLIKEPKAPSRSPLDIQGMRSQIYGSAQPTMGKPFEMRSPFASGSPLFAEKNPFDAPALPGASAEAAGAASAPQPAGDAAGPPPGPAVDGVTPELPSDAAQPPTGAGAAPLGAQNPLNTPAFSPYRINMADVVARNQAQMQPFLQGVNEAAPPSSINFSKLNQGILNSGVSPSVGFGLQNQALTHLIHLYNGQQAAEAAGARIQQSRTNAEDMRDERARKSAQTRAYRIVQNDAVSTAKKQLNAAYDALSFVDAAVLNPNAANTLVTKMYTANENGLITNQDFTRTSEGARSLAERWRQGALQIINPGRTVIRPEMAADIKEMLTTAFGNQRRIMQSAAEKLTNLYRASKSEAERVEYEDQFRVFFPEEFYPPEMKEDLDGGSPGAAPSGPTRQPPPASNDLGVVPLPRPQGAAPGATPRTRPKRDTGPAPGTKATPVTAKDVDEMSPTDALNMLIQLRKQREAEP